MTPELLTAIIGVGGLGAILPKVIDAFGAWRSGRMREEKEKNRGIVSRLAAAESGLEREIIYRRVVEESLAAHRHLLIEVYGVPVEKLPPWPVRRVTK